MSSWVCGGGRGIGAAIVRLARQRNETIFFSTRSRERTDADILETPHHSRPEHALMLEGDLEDPDTLNEHLSWVLSREGKLESIYMCAHRNFQPTDLADESWENFENQFIGSLRPIYNLVQTLCTKPAVFDGLSIVAMSSCSVVTGCENMAARNVGKASLEAFVRSASNKISKYGGRINGLSVGWTDTPQLLDFVQQGGHIPLQQIPIGRVATPEEIARTALFLGSQESSYIAGSIFPVAGGLAPDVR